ncbi:e0a53f66-12be-4bda-8da2-b858c5642d6d [Sclerotinia trifoliorum]|uniref:E0a53f66-12be-4bda-8da2-b858c5642d6d n=1 Tax=Sclerotinia trifoliorum TaxID=28548 RepID=A0A8H2W359_9HELO|nr:e0a53f66-12be-4bda-8da2-b858c5642d6d [Sclerotinia trifoliorum]
MGKIECWWGSCRDQIKALSTVTKLEFNGFSQRVCLYAKKLLFIGTKKGRYAVNMIDTTIRLRRAIHTPDASLVKRILKSHPNLLHNPDLSPHGLSNTSLHLACSLGHLDVASLLLSLGHESLSISLNEEHQTALMLAASAGHTDIVNLLCMQGPAISGILRRDMRGRDAIMYASRGGHDTCLQILLTFAAVYKDPKEVLANSDVDGNTALHFASSNGHMLVLRTLLAAGADAERRNVWMWTPISYSSTIQAEVYFKKLVSEVGKRKETRVEVKASSFPGFGRGEKKGGGVRIVEVGDD